VPAYCPTGDPLVGKFFHSFKDDKVEWQGTVLARLADDRYLVQLFDWFLGYDYVQKIVPLPEMRNWQFYDCAEAMADWYRGYDRRQSQLSMAS
jgi:hypothetical protein